MYVLSFKSSVRRSGVYLQQLLDVPDISSLHWTSLHVEVAFSFSYSGRSLLDDDLTGDTQRFSITRGLNVVSKEEFQRFSFLSHHAPHLLDLNAVTFELIVPRRVSVDVVHAIDQFDLKTQSGW